LSLDVLEDVVVVAFGLLVGAVGIAVEIALGRRHAARHRAPL
jgi:hypothetical protein